MKEALSEIAMADTPRFFIHASIAALLAWWIWGNPRRFPAWSSGKPTIRG